MSRKVKSLWPQLPKWKQIVLSTNAWPRNLVVPEEESVPRKAGVPLAGDDENRHWQWELRRTRAGRYLFRVWPYGSPTAHIDDRKAARMSVDEAWEFALTNSMPRCLMKKIGLLRKGTQQRRRISNELA